MATSAPQQELLSLQRLVDTGQFDQAWTRMEPLLAACPDDLDLEYLHGVLEFRRGSLDQASAIFAGLLERDPMMYRAQYGLGLVAAKAGSRDDAIAAYERTLYLRPTFAPARDRLRELGAEVPPPAVPRPRQRAQPDASQPPRPEPPPRAAQEAPRAPAAHRYVEPPPPPARPPRMAATSVNAPTAPATDLTRLVPWPVRAIRGVLLLGLGALCAWSVFIAVLAGWALLTQDEDSDLTEAANFGSVAAAVAVVTALVIRAVAHLGSVTLTGVASQVRFRQDVSGNPRNPKHRWVIAFVLIPDDRHQYRFPRIPVELRTKQVHGEIGNGEPVLVVGRPVRDGYLKARRIRARDSGLTFRG